MARMSGSDVLMRIRDSLSRVACAHAPLRARPPVGPRFGARYASRERTRMARLGRTDSEGKARTDGIGRYDPEGRTRMTRHGRTDSDGKTRVEGLGRHKSKGRPQTTRMVRLGRTDSDGTTRKDVLGCRKTQAGNIRVDNPSHFIKDFS